MSESEPSRFVLQPKLMPWLGGESRVFAFDNEDDFKGHLPPASEARSIVVSYAGGGLTALLESIAFSAGVTPGGFQATLENLEGLTHDRALVIVVSHADRLLGDVGPAVIHLITGWELFTHHGSGISAMYLVLETGPREIVNAAFHPGGVVDWMRKND